ncbi:MAG TPA: hypothetical protein GXX38_09915, partial [Clostridia bacterium]|nr:hypothetical protein [Clostridia bacterium]
LGYVYAVRYLFSLVVLIYTQLKNSEGISAVDEARILKKGKWKARIHNALTAIGIMVVGTIICSIFTAVYFAWGEPNRIETYHDIVASTIAVTQPNLYLRNYGTSVKHFFSSEINGELYKQVGSEFIKEGEIKVDFLLARAGYLERKWLNNYTNRYVFRYPGTANEAANRDWNKLERLPEGTVAEVYLSFDQLYSTAEILNKFKDRQMKPVWFAVDTSFDNTSEGNATSIHFPIGFSYEPVWHNSDMIITRQEEEKYGLMGKAVSTTGTYPELEAYGSAELREAHFIKTLELLKQHEDIANRVALGPELKLQQRIDYVKEHGVNIYGAVVTGPTKEILKLREEPWVAAICLGEAKLWNWDYVE